MASLGNCRGSVIHHIGFNERMYLAFIELTGMINENHARKSEGLAIPQVFFTGAQFYNKVTNLQRNGKFNTYKG